MHHNNERSNIPLSISIQNNVELVDKEKQWNHSEHKM